MPGRGVEYPKSGLLRLRITGMGAFKALSDDLSRGGVGPFLRQENTDEGACRRAFIKGL